MSAGRSLVVLVRVCEDISTCKPTEYIIDNKQCRLRLFGASSICLHAINGDPLALLLVAFADNWRNGAASLGLCRHVRESSGTGLEGLKFETCSESVVCGEGSEGKRLGEMGSQGWKS
jgi:hypothetical protein